MTDETKKNIDDMNYESMLSLHRFAPSGHPYFIGETGTYFAESMQKKRKSLEDGEHVRISKAIGWDK